MPLQNDNNQSYGDVTFTDAFTYSINTVFAQVAVSLGIGTMTDYMKRFGFYAKPPLDYPVERDELQQALLLGGQAPGPGGPARGHRPHRHRPGRSQVTPMQMAMVVAAVANGGKLMAPHFATKVVNQDGQTVQTIGPSVYNQVMKPSVAGEINQMMRKVVEEGTGTPASARQHQRGRQDRHGLASAPRARDLTEPWFIGFAPADNPKVAVAVTIERTQGGFGATVAAPIARDVIQTLL